MQDERTDPLRPDDPVDPDVLPEDAPRGGITVPDANDTGIMTPPVAGWGEVPPHEPPEPDDEPPEPDEE